MAQASPLGTFDDAAAELATPADAIRWGAARFEAAGLHFGHGTADAIDDAAALVLFAAGLPPDADAAALAAPLDAPRRRAVHALLARRIAERKPTAYLTGEAWFCGLRFAVDERVLVPRSPIAELIERGFEPWLAGGHDPARVRRVLDLCTGSGCIAIACAYAFPEATVDATDLSRDALAVAADNVAAHGLGARVALHLGDLWAGCAGPYDLVVANPPYVDAEEMAALPAEHRHEPALALASGGDGLAHAVRILRESAARLAPDGLLCLEVGGSWPALEARFPTVPFTWVEFERGGDGVLVMARDELVVHAAAFAAGPAAEAR
jgi:ribosomal protein L3 glutamine methyltransferase